MAVVTMPGAASGAMTRTNAWNGRGPVHLGRLFQLPRDSRKNADSV